MSGQRGWPGQEYAIYPGQCQQEGLLGSQEHALSSVCLFLSPTLASCTDDRSLIYPQGGANPRRPQRPPRELGSKGTSASHHPDYHLPDYMVSWPTRPSHPPVEVGASPTLVSVRPKQFP